jgi:hemerythrin-like domain-containing protein
MGVAIDQLKKEHEAIQKMLLIVEKVCGRLGSGKKVEPEHLKQIIEFFQVFADKCHHGKEEEFLFPALEEAGIPKEGGPIGVMLREHDLMRGYVKGLEEAVGHYQAGEEKAASAFVQYGLEYVATLRQHMDKENNILFQMAIMHLDAEKERELSEQFEIAEAEKIGKGKHQEFHEILDGLGETYLKG